METALVASLLEVRRAEGAGVGLREMDCNWPMKWNWQSSISFKT